MSSRFFKAEKSDDEESSKDSSEEDESSEEDSSERGPEVQLQDRKARTTRSLSRRPVLRSWHTAKFPM